MAGRVACARGADCAGSRITLTQPPGTRRGSTRIGRSSPTRHLPRSGSRGSRPRRFSRWGSEARLQGEVHECRFASRRRYPSCPPSSCFARCALERIAIVPCGSTSSAEAGKLAHEECVEHVLVGCPDRIRVGSPGEVRARGSGARQLRPPGQKLRPVLGRDADHARVHIRPVLAHARTEPEQVPHASNRAPSRAVHRHARRRPDRRRRGERSGAAIP